MSAPKLDIEQRARAAELMEDVINKPEDVAYELIWLRDEVQRLAPLAGGITPIGTESDNALASVAPSEAAVAAACEALYHSEWRDARLDPYELAKQMRSVLQAAYVVDSAAPRPTRPRRSARTVKCWCAIVASSSSTSVLARSRPGRSSPKGCPAMGARLVVWWDTLCARYGWWGCPRWPTWRAAYRWARAYHAVIDT